MSRLFGYVGQQGSTGRALELIARGRRLTRLAPIRALALRGSVALPET